MVKLSDIFSDVEWAQKVANSGLSGKATPPEGVEEEVGDEVDVTEPEEKFEVEEESAEEEFDEADEEIAPVDEETADDAVDEETGEELVVSPKEHPLKLRAAPRTRSDTFLCIGILCHISFRA